jgi:hypothetical protein
MFGPDFYPTPRKVAQLMLKKLSADARNILEPSAGKGDLAKVLVGDTSGYRRGRRVDVIEAEPDLVHVLRAIEGVNVVGFDWLTYDGISYYDAIVMNPPFSNGAAHLLRAWDFMHSGEIVCLLNQETIDNPYTEERRRLAEIIAKHGNVEALGQCFSTAQRPTDVSVAMVYLKKVSEDDRVEVWHTTPTDEKPIDDEVGNPEALPAVLDRLGNLEHYYNQSLSEMFKGFAHIRKAALFMDALGCRLRADGKDRSVDIGEILELATRNITSARAEFARALRGGAWEHAFGMVEFDKWLDSRQVEDLMRDVRQNSAIPFTAENVRGTLTNVLAQRRKLFEQSAWNVFEALTKHHKGNTSGTEGWKTNDSFKVNKRLVFPYGCDYSFSGFTLYQMYRNSAPLYRDLDRVLAVLDGQRFDSVTTIADSLEAQWKVDPRHPGSCQSTYFDIRFFMKGTVHLAWRRPDLLEKFNITAAAGRRWIGEDTRRGATASPTTAGIEARS